MLTAPAPPPAAAALEVAPPLVAVLPALVPVPLALVPVAPAADEVAPPVVAPPDELDPEPPQAATPSASAAALSRMAGCLNMTGSPCVGIGRHGRGSGEAVCGSLACNDAFGRRFLPEARSAWMLRAPSKG